jgi:hypothetical protein
VSTGRERWAWPDELDALAAAPDHHELLLENERVRVLRTLVPTGQATAIHTHRWPNVQYIVSTSDFVRRTGDGEVAVDTREGDGPPEREAVLWSDPIPPHSLENVGRAELCVIMVELKGGPAPTASTPPSGRG